MATIHSQDLTTIYVKSKEINRVDTQMSNMKSFFWILKKLDAKVLVTISRIGFIRSKKCAILDFATG